MPKIELKLECSPCRLKFESDNKYPLRSQDEKYRRQVFMDGICPQCAKDCFGWVGLNKGQAENYYPISAKHAKRWYDRLDSDLIKEHSVKIDTTRFSKKRMKTVNGFKKEINSGKWMPQIQVVR